MRIWKVAFLITGLLMLSAVIGLAEEKAPTPAEKACKKACSSTVETSACDQEKMVKVEISESDAPCCGHQASHSQHAKAFMRRPGHTPHMEYTGEPQAWLGVAMKDLNEQLGDYFEVKDGKGTLIEEVIEDSPAADSGLRAGDVIVKMGGRDIENSGDVIEVVSDLDIGEKVKIEVKRKGKKKSFEVELAEREADSFAWAGSDDEFDVVWNMKSPRRMKMMQMLHEDQNTDLPAKVEEMRADIAELKAILEDLNNERK